MKVVEIFKSIDGEGKRAGMPATFIRLAFCNLRCTYCDTSTINKRIYPDEIEKYISDGWRKGMYSKRSKKITI